MDTIKNSKDKKPDVINFAAMEFDDLVAYLMTVWGYDRLHAEARAVISLGISKGDVIEVEKTS